MDPVDGAEDDYSVVSAQLTVQAMRDSGYKDTDHAIAELIDNSVEARARLIEMIVVETPRDPDVPYDRARISEIAVADDGVGMDLTTLRRALRFGDGTRLGRSSRGIGRFGVGLPVASVSQCRRVDIWTWQNGADNALRCHLDLDQINSGANQIPRPIHDPVPDRWRAVARSTSELTGTLVVWSNLDRVRWQGSEKTLDRTAELCGRIYRKFLADPERPVQITLLLAIDDGTGLTPVGKPEPCLPNDPLYLRSPSSTPPPFSTEPMFELFNEMTWTVPADPGVDADSGEIRVGCSMARPDAINEAKSAIPWPRSYARAGDSPWGKHADRNKGVSVVRAGRELELSQAWTNSYEPEERWWSVEVEFDPVLDDIFGVVNNKQHAHAFVAGAGFKWKEAADSDESLEAFRERLIATNDPRAHLQEVWTWMDDQISRMRKERGKIMEGTGTSRVRHPKTGEDVEDVATNVINEQAGAEDAGSEPDVSPEEKIERIAESARRRRVDADTAKEWAEETVLNGRRFLMKGVSLGHRDAFFDVEAVNDIIEVWLNDQHPVYEHLIEVVTREADDQGIEDLVERLNEASFTLRMLLFAWAWYEHRAPIGEDKQAIQDFRMDWGRDARILLGPLE